MYDGYKVVEALYPSCTQCLKKGRQCFQNYNPCYSKCHHFFVGKKPYLCPGASLSNVRQYLWSKKDGPFGKEFPDSEAPTPDVAGSRMRDVAQWTNVGGPITMGGRPIYSSSEVLISRIKNQGVVKRIRRISNSPTNPDAEGSDELDGGEVEVVLNHVGHQASTSNSQNASKRFQIQVIPSTLNNFQQVLPTIPPPSPKLSTARPAMV
ncbi:hypothetical protein O181_048502 [Austropuccinia psidii MF-1]|uniref:Uncharacterized protein n=1 Tax=Austropuccinia psidii MF-1 TaxID=1389203 RepID=A0A9Q3E004_9BASI|nr:hypothetical protein [Austropuccinia psidii MF-1]